MKKLTIFLVVVFVATILIAPAHALKKVGQTGLQFLKVDAAARAAAMAGAYTMVGNDASAMFYNPAGMGLMENSLDFFSGMTQWIAEINYSYAAIAKNLGNWGTVGANIIYSDYGDDIIGTQVAATEQGYVKLDDPLDVGAYAIGLSYAKSLTNKFTIGGTVRYASQQLGESQLIADGPFVENKVSGLAFDFGTIFYPGFKSLSFGMCVNNFSQQFKYEEEAFQLPLTFRIGAAIDALDFLGDHENSLVVALDAIHPRDYTERIHLGGEYWFKGMLAVRAGYKFNYDEEGITAGIGLKYSIIGMSIKLDYSYSDLGLFDSVSRFSLGLSL